MESMILAQLTPRRFRACLPLIFAVCLVLVASIPAVAGDSERPVHASIFVSSTESSPADNLSFWIWIEPLKQKARKLVITEAPLDGLEVLSTTIPDSCLESRRTWVCIQDDLRPFSIAVQAVAGPGTEGRDLVYGGSVALWKNGEGNEDSMDPIQLSSIVHVVPASVVGEPKVDVQLEANESAIMPGNPVTYRVDVTNLENTTAHNVSVVVTIPTAMVVTSAAPEPTIRDGRLTWILNSVPVGSTWLFFTATLPPANALQQVDAAVAATYGNASGGQVRLANVPTSLVVLPMRPQAPLSPLPALFVLAVLAFVLKSLFLPAGPLVPALRGPAGPAEVFLLHRSGILLHHVTPIHSAGLDSDIVGGMLSAIRMFVETTMDPSTGPLQEIRFRGGSIVFVTGENATLAALNAKGNRVRFGRRALGFLRQFEKSNAQALKNFDGGASPLLGIDDLMSRISS